MRSTGIDPKRCSLDQLRRKQRRGADGYDLVIVAVQDESGNVELLEVLGEVSLGELLDAVEAGFVRGQHTLQPERITQALRDLGTGAVRTIKRRAEIFEKL